MIRALAKPVALLLALWLLAAHAPAAWAHASLLATEPADGAVVADAPTTITMRFNEPVAPIVFRLVAPDGTSTDLTQVAASDAVVRISLPALTAHGTHLLSWRVISADGHPVGGSFVFSVGAPSAAPRVAPADAGIGPVHCLLWLAKLGLYLGLFVGVGGSFARAVLTDDSGLPSAAERVLRWAILGGAGATMLHVCLQGLDVLDRPLSSAIAPDVWRAGLSGGTGLLVLLAFLSQGLALAALAEARVRRRQILSIAAMAALGAALASTGHAASAPPQFITRPAVFLHTVAVAFWIGALLPLAWLFRTARADRRVALERFSRAIPWSLTMLVFAGGTLAYIQLGTFRAIWTTAYGLILGTKLVAVVALLTLAAWNRYRLTPLLQVGEPLAERRFRKIVGSELLLVTAILALVAGWRFTPPPRALQIAPAVTQRVHIHGRDADAELEVSIERGAPAAIAVRLTKDGEASLEADEVTLLFDDPRRGLEPIRRRTERHADGTWRITGLALPSAATWRVQVDILVSDFREIRLEGEITP